MSLKYYESRELIIGALLAGALVIAVILCMGITESMAENACAKKGAEAVSTDGKGTYICVDPSGRIVP